MGCSVPGNDGDASGLGKASGGGLVPQQVEKVGCGAHKGDACSLASSGQGGVLGKEAVPGVDGVHFLLFRQSYNALDV